MRYLLRLTLRLVLLGGLMYSLAGCNTVTTTQPLAPGYLNQADQTMGEILAASRAFYTTIQSESANGTMVLTAQEKQAFNTFGVSLNAAESVYLAYHANATAANQAIAQSAVNALQTQQAALPLPTVTK